MDRCELLTRFIGLLFMALSVSFPVIAQKTEVVSINEPGTYQLRALYKRADRVALVKIVAGGTENYEKAVYKAKTLAGYKNSHPGEIFYFGPFVGERLGAEYLLFLLDTHEQLSPKPGNSSGYGPVHYWKIFDEGYTSMEVSYECVFEGQDPSSKCDYGVRVCTDYIKLPKSLPAFPPENNDPLAGAKR